MLRRLSFIVRFLRDRRGVSAIEFALVAPLLICAYLGMAELTLGMLAARHTSHLAATIGDLASQSDNLTDANVSDLWAIGGSMLQPFSTTGLRMRVTEVMMTTTSPIQAVVVWSEQSNWTAYTKNTPITAITTSQLAQGQYLIMTEVQYDYSSPIGNFLPGVTHFSDTFYHQPRNGLKVLRNGA